MIREVDLVSYLPPFLAEFKENTVALEAENPEFRLVWEGTDRVLKSKSYIYFWRARWDGSAESLACQSRRPPHHPRKHTEEELKLIRGMRCRNSKLSLIELRSRLREQGYFSPPGEPVPGHAKVGDISGGETEGTLYAQTL